ncbi:Delta-aminolevulinic acid dehydratase [bioreactor metagenome]|uniref:Delta-aminolevulinic acid dehydratase n=1 Tax=bioreactor metagenome TaxID=1076179 RepID=A0A644XVS1_9ZZZZ|nr:porphobilinogen synthase [Paludibacter sp.]
MKRFRPYRTDAATRERYADVQVQAPDFIYPLFIVEGKNQQQIINTLPGVFRFSIDMLSDELAEITALGINKVLLFGVIDNALKNTEGTAGYNPDSLVCRTVRYIKQHFPRITVFTDVCLCEYTSHGHCGLLHGDQIDNDSTLPVLARIALSHAQAGADFVAPSAMMDGQVQAIREALTSAGLKTKILSYSAKYASSFYGPFRDAAGSAPSFGDRKSYQMDYRTRDQGLAEIVADIEEGADWVMVKPAQTYLDIIQRAAVAFPKTPLAAYQVSGEYAMLKNAAESHLLNEEQAFKESLTAIKRAGAQYIISYYAKEFIRKGL